MASLLVICVLLQLNYEITIGDKDQPIRCVCEKVGVSCQYEGVTTIVVQDQVIILNSVQPFAISRKITNMKVSTTVSIT